eukprot:12075323-Alexandrium_andersonii.AAC.1
MSLWLHVTGVTPQTPAYDPCFAGSRKYQRTHTCTFKVAERWSPPRLRYCAVRWCRTLFARNVRRSTR